MLNILIHNIIKQQNIESLTFNNNNILIDDLTTSKSISINSIDISNLTDQNEPNNDQEKISKQKDKNIDENNQVDQDIDFFGKVKKTTYSEVYNILEELFHKQSK